MPTTRKEVPSRGTYAYTPVTHLLASCVYSRCVIFNRELTVCTATFADGKKEKTQVSKITLNRVINPKFVEVDAATLVCAITKAGREELVRLYTKKSIAIAHESTIGSMRDLVMAAAMRDVPMNIEIRTHRKSLILGLVTQVRAGILRATSFGEFCLGRQATVRREFSSTPPTL